MLSLATHFGPDLDLADPHSSAPKADAKADKVLGDLHAGRTCVVVDSSLGFIDEYEKCIQ